MKKVILWLLATILCGCNPNQKEPQTPTGPVGNKAVEGFVQKGPFISGTSIKLQTLDKEFNPTGYVYEKQITDDRGSFSFTQIDGLYGELIANGFYFNEVSGKLSSAQITLRSIIKINELNKSNVNVLTTLQASRIRNLVANGATFDEAAKQSQCEILSAFGINEISEAIFDQMDITQSQNYSAILLAISAIVQQNITEAQMSELIAKLANDIASDGKIDDKTLKSSISRGSSYANIMAGRILSNIYYQYKKIGVTNIDVPNFLNFIDADSDGRLNKETPYLNLYDSFDGLELETSPKEPLGISKETLRFEILAMSNNDCKISIPQEATWIRKNEELSSATLLVFDIDQNTNGGPRTVELTFATADQSITKSVWVEQLGTYTKLNISISNDAEHLKQCTNVVVAGFDTKNGDLLFISHDKSPSVSDNGVYSAYFKHSKAYEQCNLYVITNSVADFANFTGNEEQFIANASAMNYEEMLANNTLAMWHKWMNNYESQIELRKTTPYNKININICRLPGVAQCKFVSLALTGSWSNGNLFAPIIKSINGENDSKFFDGNFDITEQPTLCAATFCRLFVPSSMQLTVYYGTGEAENDKDNVKTFSINPSYLLRLDEVGKIYTMNIKISETTIVVENKLTSIDENGEIPLE